MALTSQSLWSLLLVMAVAALAPIATRLIPGHPPQVLFLILGGIVVGPPVLGWAHAEDVSLFSELGLGFVFLLAGYELNPRLLVQRAGRQALIGWAISALLAGGVVALLESIGMVRAFVPLSIALTTTALGTLLPILREQHMLGGTFGRVIFAAGAAGELLPIIATSLFLGAYRTWREVIIVSSIAALAVVIAFVTRLVGRTRFGGIVLENSHETSQATLRVTVVLLVGLLLVTQEFGVEAALGAFFAGMVLRLSSGTHERRVFDDKLDTVGYGVFIPVFFVSSGITLDVASIIGNPLRTLMFAGLLLVVRGVPALLIYRRTLVLRERVEAVLLTATSLPLLVALAQIGLSSGTMFSENAAALIGAGVLSVAVFPIAAIALRSRALAAAD